MSPIDSEPERTRLGDDEATARGMRLAVRARLHPERTALIAPGVRCSFDALNRRVNQLARGLRAAGLRPGDGLALLAISVAGPLAEGVGVVLMDGFEAREALELVERHRVSHTHLVPTMFHRLLALDERERSSRDLSSLRFVVHGAAPCSASLKRRMMDWLGPILYEYYSATEGFGSFATPEEWLAKPGTVGRPKPGRIQVRDEQGHVLDAERVGCLFIRAPEKGRFVYHGDPEKTRDTYDRSGEFFSLGDLGRLDADGYLFLTDRSADLILCGGVNVYPAEVDAVLLEEPRVRDAAAIGIPDEVYGESVHGVVELREGVEPSPALAREIIDFCRNRLAHYKCPRSIEFSDALPRHETGKIFRRRLREQYRVQAGGEAANRHRIG